MRLRLRIATGTLGVIGALGMLAAPAGVAAVSATPSAASAVTTAACTDGHWPAAVQGVPKTFKAGARSGDYIWHDSKGWHLRVTHPGHALVVFSGTIHSSSPLDATPVKLEKNDWIAVSADHKTITYRLTNYGYIDGFDFKTSCAKALTFRGLVAGHRLGIGHIWVGHYGRHPLENPFVIRRIR
jgi:hypothetical protein